MLNMASMRVLIADDERPSRAFLASMLATFAGVTVVAEARTGREAVRLNAIHRPDVLFLDLQMPEMDGLAVVGALNGAPLPLVVFVTAFDEFATRAFDLGVVDYLTKPVDRQRLQQTIRRLEDRLAGLDDDQAAGGALVANHVDSPRRTNEPWLKRVPVKRADGIAFVPTTQIASVVAERELLHITTRRLERHIISYRLKNLEARLDPDKFIRLGRGALVNIDAIVSVTPQAGGVCLVRLDNGQTLQTSRIQTRSLRLRLFHL